MHRLITNHVKNIQGSHNKQDQKDRIRLSNKYALKGNIKPNTVNS